MNNRLKSWIRSFLSLNKGERQGIIVLAVIIILLNVGNLILPKLIKPKISPQFFTNQKIVAEFLADQKAAKDSIKQIIKINNNSRFEPDNLFQFDPNTANDAELKKIGFSQKQIKNIINYRAHGGVFSKKDDLKKIYSISEEEYLIIEPFVIIAPPINKKQIFIFTEINSADSALLVKNLHFSPHITGRIIKYRNLLGGYYNSTQLYEVYNIRRSELERALPYIKTDNSFIRKLDINKVDFKELLRHPYFDYKITKSIFDYRKTKGQFKSVIQYKDSLLIPDSVFNRQKYYLYIRPHEIKTDTL